MVAGSSRAAVASALVCHRDKMVALATAAVLEKRQVAERTVIATSLSGALARLGDDVEIAVVFDSVDEDVQELFEAMNYRGLRTPVVVVCESAEPEYAARVLESGASGLISGRSTADDLCRALQKAHNGQVVISSDMRDAVLAVFHARRTDQLEAERQLAGLAPSDLEILRLLSDGVTVAQIARRLSLSPHTVRGRLRVIGTRLGVSGQLRVAALGRQLLASTHLADSGRARDNGKAAALAADE